MPAGESASEETLAATYTALAVVYYQDQGPSRKPRWYEEIFIIVRAVFGVLFIPLAVLIGFIVWLVATFAAFSAHWALGLLCLALMAVAIGIFAYWDSHQPPRIQS